MSTRCPSCQAESTTDLGVSYFSGWSETCEVAELNKLCGNLFVCGNCDLVFRWPVPSDKALEKVYEGIPASSWNYAEPHYWGWSQDAIEQWSPNRRVLDIGCFRGDFLNTLATDIERYGVEPNREAAKIAEGRGVKMIGRFGQDVSREYYGTFGAIVLMDVLEHLSNPVAALGDFQKLLAPGGIFIILTGDSTPWFVRRSLPFYWYMSFPIHLVHLGARYARWIEGQLHLERLAFRRLAHEQHSVKDRVKQYIRMAGVLLHNQLGGKGLAAKSLRLARFIREPVRRQQPPLIFGLRDHFWLVTRSASQRQ